MMTQVQRSSSLKLLEYQLDSILKSTIIATVQCECVHRIFKLSSGVFLLVFHHHLCLWHTYTSHTPCNPRSRAWYVEYILYMPKAEARLDPVMRMRMRIRKTGPLFSCCIDNTYRSTYGMYYLCLLFPVGRPKSRDRSKFGICVTSELFSQIMDGGRFKN